MKKILISFQLIILSPIIFLILFLRIFFKIKIIEIETRAIGHYALQIEIFLCEILNKIHNQNNIYFAFRNKVVANKYLYNKYKKNFIILPRIILEPIFLFFNHKLIYNLLGKKFTSAYRHWTKNYTQDKPFQYVDIYNVLPKTPPTIKFNKNEINFGKNLLKKINLNEEDKYVCLHLRTPHYYYNRKVLNKFKYSMRDSKKENYFKTVNYLAKKSIKTVLIGEDIQNSRKDNKIIYYNKSDIKNDFLDIYLLYGCKYLIGSSSGMSVSANIFRKKIVFVNIAEIHRINMDENIYKPIILLKKFKSLETGEYISYPRVLEKKLSTIQHLDDLNKLGYDVEDNSEEEMLKACEEMEHHLEKKEYLNYDSYLEKKFNKILLKYNGSALQHSKISFSFLKKNSDLLE